MEFEDILEKYPRLTEFGFGSGKPEDFERSRTNLINANRVIVFLSSWLREHVPSSKGFNKSTSYGLKHQVESRIGIYITNGEFIAAAIMAEYEIKRLESDNPNCLVKIQTISE